MVKGRETLGLQLPRTLAEGTDVKTTAGTDHTEWVEPGTFPRSIAHFASNKEERAMEAKRHTN